MSRDVVTLALTGDVMLGRGVDQVLPHPVDPRLWERHVGDARRYVDLAEAANGPVPRPVDWRWPWGVALDLLDEAAPDARVVNLETSVTHSDDAVPGKAVHYRMAPENLPALLAADPDVCVLANNHVADLGDRGLLDTLDALARAGLRTAGAGRDEEAAWAPAAVPLPGGRRLLVLGVGTTSAGVPPGWAATRTRPGVAHLRGPSPQDAAAVLARLAPHRRADDLVVVSVHWGSNWGHDVPEAHRAFAHALVDGGVDVVHGHSSHHPRPVELHAGAVVLHGCGDLVNDYEGIRGHEAFRSDLRLLHLVTLDAATGAVTSVRMAPLVARRLRLEHADEQEAQWLAATLDRTSRPLGTAVDIGDRGWLTAVPA